MYITNNDANLTSWYTSPGWFTWVKPIGVSFIQIIMRGAGGGGGGGGATSASTTIGGSGGAGGNCSRILTLTNLIPDVLYVYVGAGGAGGTGHINGAGGSNGTAGETTFVSVYKDTTSQNRIAQAAGGLGGNVASTTGGASGSTTFTPRVVPQFIVPQDALGTSGTGAGSGNANGTAYNLATSSNFCIFTPGGTGGGGAATGSTIYIGGVYNGYTNSVPYATFPTLTATAGQAGGGGTFFIEGQKYLCLGGQGGHSSRTTAVPGGRGGDGVMGSGGGGGGAFRGDTTTQGGAGGTGGNGWVLIIAR